MTAKTSRWSRLDNAAKIFPSSTSRRDSKVFRFYCQLDRPVEPEHLTLAVEQVLAHFPFYRCTMRKGMFWYFLEESRKFPRVAQESEPPCAQKAPPDRHDLLLSVSYYRCRINVEMYHALADGTGALDFLKALVCRYLVLCHPQLAGEEPQFDGSLQERMADSFRQHYRGEKMARRGFHLQPAAYHLSGRKLPGGGGGLCQPGGCRRQGPGGYGGDVPVRSVPAGHLPADARQPDQAACGGEYAHQSAQLF